MLQISFLFIVVFVALYVYGQITLQPVRAQLEKLDQDLVALNSRVAQMEKETPATGSRLLENEIARLSAELARRKQIQSMLASRTLGNTEGLSIYLEAFARQHVQGTWLTKIKVADGGAVINLNGKTLSSELVPIYINRLAAESPLNGMAFNVMELIRPVEPSSHLDFYVSTN